MLAVNVFDFDSLESLATTFGRKGRPVMAQFSARFFQLHSPATVVAWRKAIPGVELWLHLDHCADLELFEACAAAGFDSVMFDGSESPLPQNIVASQRAIRLARRRNLRVLVECEIGHVSGVEDGMGSDGPGHGIPTLTEVLAYYAAVQPDLFAVGFGNKHGHYRGGDFFDLELMKQVGRALPRVPLVLHGGSGMPLPIVRRLVRGGHCKLNISTDLKVAWIELLRRTAAQTDSPLAAVRMLRQGLQEFFAGLEKKYRSILVD